jgi:hypothetical protein
MFVTKRYDFKKNFTYFFMKYMDSFNELDYLYFIILFGLKNKINEIEFNKYKFSDEKLKEAENFIYSFCERYNDLDEEVNKPELVVKEFYDSLKKAGETVEDYLETNKKSLNTHQGKS